MRRQPTNAILVIAILHLVGGGLDLAGSLCGCGGLILTNSIGSLMPAPPTLPARSGQPPPPPLPNFNDMMKSMNDQIPGYLAFTIVSLALSFLLDIMLLSGGVGLLKMQPWARWLSLVYAPISILVRIGTAVYQLIWVLPATQAMFAKSMAAPAFSSFMTVSSGIGVFVNLLFCTYPIAVIIVLLLPSTAAAFRGEISVRNVDGRGEEAFQEDPWRQSRSDKFRQ
jgi:hypothetical protein